MEKYIEVGNLPHHLLSDVSESIRFHTITFVRGIDAVRDPGLLGSGVLVSAGGVRAILTADHVLDELPDTGRIGIFLTRDSAFESIDAAGIRFLRIARGKRDSEGPDIGALVLAPALANTIAAKKTFYNLDLQRMAVLQRTPGVHDGVWAAQGFLEEATVLERRPGAIDFFAYNFTAFGGPDAVTRAGEYDYVDFLVSCDVRPTAPQRWGGMSGGGLWQIGVRDGEPVIARRPVLAGILFYQYPTSEQVCGVKGHAWRSVYDIAYSAIAAAR